MSARSRKRREKFIERSRRRRPGGVHNIPSFCLNNDISESKYFSLKRQGRGPREIELDGRIIITEEAERDWHAAMEAETQARRQAAASSRSAAPIEASA
jgi:hypothetical protein